jgi:hypothetical protein
MSQITTWNSEKVSLLVGIKLDGKTMSNYRKLIADLRFKKKSRFDKYGHGHDCLRYSGMALNVFLAEDKLWLFAICTGKVRADYISTLRKYFDFAEFHSHNTKDLHKKR